MHCSFKIKVMEFKVVRLFIKYLRVLLKLILVRINVRNYTTNSTITHLGLRFEKICAKVEPI